MRINFFLTILAVLLFSFCAHADTSGSGKTIPCNLSALVASTTGEVQIVPPIAGQSVYVCGFDIVSTAAATVNFAQGTGTNCGTGTGTIGATWALGSNTVVTDSSSTFRGLKTAPGTALCINSTTGSPAGVEVFYTQF